MPVVKSFARLDFERKSKFCKRLMRKKLMKYLVAIGSVVVLVAVVYSFLFGKLFPYSPIIVGFSKNELTNTVIYIQNGAEYSDLEKIDSLISGVESFHEWEFLKKPRIFIFKDKNNYNNRSISKARFCVFYNGDLVISPWALKEAENGEISLEIYLTHELSHSLLYQHSGLLRAFRYPEWLLEGTAVYSANQMGTSWYPSREETHNYIRKGNFMPPEYFKTRKEDQIDLDVKHRITFMYSEFACIVDYLIERYGKEKFLSYIKEITTGGNHDKIFQIIYGTEFNKSIHDFREAIVSQS